MPVCKQNIHIKRKYDIFNPLTVKAKLSRPILRLMKDVRRGWKRIHQQAALDVIIPSILGTSLHEFSIAKPTPC
jgi:hypothetical protein